MRSSPAVPELCIHLSHLVRFPELMRTSQQNFSLWRPASTAEIHQTPTSAGCAFAAASPPPASPGVPAADRHDSSTCPPHAATDGSRILATFLPAICIPATHSRAATAPHQAILALPSPAAIRLDHSISFGRNGSCANSETSIASVPHPVLGGEAAEELEMDAPVSQSCEDGQAYRDVAALLALRCASSNTLRRDSS